MGTLNRLLPVFALAYFAAFGVLAVLNVAVRGPETFELGALLALLPALGATFSYARRERRGPAPRA